MILDPATFIFGFQTLSQVTDHGGVMIFITDGVFDCRQGGTELTDQDLQDEIIASGVRIITVAFR